MRNAGIAILLAGALFSSGCSTVMAAKQPSAKNLDVLAVGSPRDVVIGELGSPVHTEVVEGKKSDIFKFVQGYSQANKTVRTIGHGVADVFTLGLWEVVGTPTEATFNGQDMSMKVIYDQGDKVEQVIYLKKK